MKKWFCVLALSFSSLVTASSIHKIVAFGDSLSDNGNLYTYFDGAFPQSPPYYQGRFTNGPVWIELLASAYFPNDTPAHFENYAYGGAGVSVDDTALFSLGREIKAYFIAHENKADSDALYSIWIGANNYLGAPSPEDKPVDKVMSGIRLAVDQLLASGAKHFLIVNVPDLGNTPAAREVDVVDRLRAITLDHNEQLERYIIDLKRSYPDVDWYYYDVNKPFTDMFKDPLAYGFTNVMETCYEALMDEFSPEPLIKMVASIKPKTLKEGCDGFLFFDPVHPTAWAHRILKEKVKIVLDEAGAEFK